VRVAKLLKNADFLLELRNRGLVTVLECLATDVKSRLLMHDFIDRTKASGAQKLDT